VTSGVHDLWKWTRLVVDARALSRGIDLLGEDERTFCAGKIILLASLLITRNGSPMQPVEAGVIRDQFERVKGASPITLEPLLPRRVGARGGVGLNKFEWPQDAGL
jgi:hypothetical protein